MLPLKTEEVVWNSHITTTTYKIGGADPVQTLEALLADPKMTLVELNALLQDVAQQIPVAVLGDLTQMKRLKVRSGLFSRGVYYNPKESGVGGWVGYPLKGKEQAELFRGFYSRLPIFVEK
jgi:hypothetical protein